MQGRVTIPALLLYASDVYSKQGKTSHLWRTDPALVSMPSLSCHHVWGVVQRGQLLQWQGSPSGCVFCLPARVSMTSYKAQVLCTLCVQQGDVLKGHIRF